MPFKLLLIYFFMGGAIISAVTYFGSQGKSQVAAFIAFLPSTSLVTLCTIYFSSGAQMAVSFGKGMLILLPPWVFYLLSVILLLPRIGLAATIAVSVSIYLILAFIVIRLVKI